MKRFNVPSSMRQLEISEGHVPKFFGSKTVLRSVSRGRINGKKLETKNQLFSKKLRLFLPEKLNFSSTAGKDSVDFFNYVRIRSICWIGSLHLFLIKPRRCEVTD